MIRSTIANTVPRESSEPFTAKDFLVDWWEEVDDQVDQKMLAAKLTGMFTMIQKGFTQ